MTFVIHTCKLGIVLSKDESEDIVDDHDVEDELDNDADDLDDVDDSEELSEHLGTEDLDEPVKDKENVKVSFAFIPIVLYACHLTCFWQVVSLI